MMTLFRRASPSGVALALVVAIGLVGTLDVEPAGAAAAQQTALSRLRERIEARYEVVPLSRGIGLRPKGRLRDVRMIEITEGLVAIDGAPVTGRELRDKVGPADAELLLQLSYLDPDERQALVGPRAGTELPALPERPSLPESPPAAELPVAPERPAPYRHRTGERVRILGGVNVARDESVDGQVVAVLGSVRVEGEVTDQVVAVLGSVDLGRDARVGGDVTAVGGRVRRAPGAEVRGSITEIHLSGPDRYLDVSGLPWYGMHGMFHPFARTARLFGTVFRVLLLALLASIVVLIAREPIERVAHRVTTEPLKAAVVGVLAELLFFPALILTTVILAVSIIGIPLLLLLPFVLVATLFVLLGGFTGTAYSVGRWAVARLGWTTDQPYLAVSIGVVVLLAPILLARIFGLAGGPFGLVAVVLVAVALLIEYVAWTMGFGAALIGVFGRWRASRSAGGAAVVPPAEA